jgi:hypothetical protein
MVGHGWVCAEARALCVYIEERGSGNYVWKESAVLVSEPAIEFTTKDLDFIFTFPIYIIFIFNFFTEIIDSYLGDQWTYENDQPSIINTTVNYLCATFVLRTIAGWLRYV